MTQETAAMILVGLAFVAGLFAGLSIAYHDAANQLRELRKELECGEHLEGDDGAQR